MPKERLNQVHVCFYASPFGVVPMELDEVYPLSQHEIVLPLDKESVEYVASQVAEYITHMNYGTVFLLNDPKNWNKMVLKGCRRACSKRNIVFRHFEVKNGWEEKVLAELEKILRSKRERHD
jgi:predicted nucleotide-binding protein (sugar kinase/HSP70/actin superfamily)